MESFQVIKAVVPNRGAVIRFQGCRKLLKLLALFFIFYSFIRIAWSLSIRPATVYGCRQISSRLDRVAANQKHCIKSFREPSEKILKFWVLDVLIQFLFLRVKPLWRNQNVSYPAFHPRFDPLLLQRCLRTHCWYSEEPEKRRI